MRFRKDSTNKSADLYPIFHQLRRYLSKIINAAFMKTKACTDFDKQMFILRSLRRPQRLFFVVIFIIALVLLSQVLFDVFGSHSTASIELEPSGRKYITVTFWGRNGNHMFEYATLLGTAKRNNMTPILIESTGLWKGFNLPMKTGTIKALGNSYEVGKERLAGGYMLEFEHLKQENTYLKGYLQSWKYFENVRKDLLTNQFVFKDKHMKEAKAFLQSVRAEHKSPKAVLVGIHIRRGDFVRQKRKGYGAAPVPFFYRAMNYYKKKYSDVIFVVCSNDIIWSQDQLDSEYYRISYSYIKDGFTDLAVLASCNHAVISVGSFSWWAGYLTGGDVVYYSVFPQKNTTMGDLYVREDYYPPWWVPM